MQRLLVVAVLVWSTIARADPLPDRTERVIGAGRVWAQVKFFHPWLGYKKIDWDAAFTAALPNIEAATTADQYRAALALMLGKLKDPVTHVVTARAATAKPIGSGNWLESSGPIVIAELEGFTGGSVWDYVAWAKNAELLANAAAKARVMVLDLRVSNSKLPSSPIDDILETLPAIDVWPIERTIEHHGYFTQEGNTSGDYYSTFSYQGALPPKHAPMPGVGYVVAIADEHTTIPRAIIALQAAGKASIVARALAEENAVTTVDVEAVPGVSVQVRLGELTWGAPTPDVVLATGDLRAKAIEIAKGAVTKWPPSRPLKPPLLPPYAPSYDADYNALDYPPRELRVLAGIRAWAVLDRFWPYRYLAGDWNKVLREALPKLEAATDKVRYLAAIKELGAKGRDGHINVWSTSWQTQPPAPPFVARMIEGKLAVFRIVDPVLAKGLAVGDVIETIDGKPAANVLATTRATVSGSTDEARDQSTAMESVFGDGALEVGVRGVRGPLRTITVQRSLANLQAMFTPPAAAHWKKLPANIGYVDLRQLTATEVPQLFTDLGGTKAIVFDMRGYPQGTAWAIAPRINTKGAKYGAQFLQPYVVPATGTEVVEEQRVRFLQTIPALPAGAPIYRGKIVVLIDWNAISQSEHSCLFFQETAGATFVGSPTAGANGDVTIMRLPGGLRMSFTGQEVRHVDGAQLQRVGIKPHILIRPTLAGLRAGKDEVLDRALAFLANGK